MISWTKVGSQDFSKGLINFSMQRGLEEVEVAVKIRMLYIFFDSHSPPEILILIVIFQP